MMYNNEQTSEEPSNDLGAKRQTNISEATEKDWEDFFAVQENLDTLFDR